MFVTDKQYVALRKRYDEYVAAGFPELDSGLQCIVESIGKIDGLVSLFSCSGHYDQTRSVRTEVYLILAVRNQQAFHRLYRIYENLCDLFPRNKNLVDLTISKLLWPAELDNDTIDCWYPTVKLSVMYYILTSFVEEECRQKHIDMFLYAIEKELCAT